MFHRNSRIMQFLAQAANINLNRVGPDIHPNKERVLLRRYYPSSDKIARRIIVNLSSFPQDRVNSQLEYVKQMYASRHKCDITKVFLDRFIEVNKTLNGNLELDLNRQILIGSYFMHEYSIETSALFNPSAVPHWDQSNLAPGSMRFILSLRACGEGHISSITFRSGIIDKKGHITLDSCSKFTSLASIVDKRTYCFPDDVTDLTERVLFPIEKHQKNGIEDARFVKFVNDDGSFRYYGTYTAYDGVNITPEMISTTDFKTFRVETLRGSIQNKGMALFPRKISGKYVMLSRQDDEYISVMTSDNLIDWDTPVIVAKPEEPWEQFKMGNCGSPIETPKGWLVLTHGVGALRQYGIGVLLLDLNDPYKVIARTKDPIVVPTENEREGYVPNVVYSCGGLLNEDLLMLPYAASDSYTSFALININDIYKEMHI